MTEVRKPRRIGRVVVALVCAAVVAQTASARAQDIGTGETRGTPTELWKEYPLDPTVGGASQAEPSGAESRETPAPALQGGGDTAENDFWDTLGGSKLWIVALALFGLALVELAILLFVSARRRARTGRPPLPPEDARELDELLADALAPSKRRREETRAGPSAQISRTDAARRTAGASRQEASTPLPAKEERRQPGRARPPAGTPSARRPRDATVETPRSSAPEDRSGVFEVDAVQAAPSAGQTPQAREAGARRQAPSSFAGQPRDRPRGAVDSEEQPWESCEIAVWRADGDARFYAAAIGPDGEQQIILKSPLFRSASSGSPSATEATRAAHRALMQQLAWDGWEVQKRGEEWWEGRFRRQLERGSVDVADR